MGRLYSTLPLFATDYSSAASAVRDCGGLAVICCPNGCMGNYVRFDEPRWAELPGNVLQLELNEKDVIFGDRDWMEEFRNLDIPKDTGFIGFVHTPVSSLVGIDTDIMCRRLKKEFGIPAVSIETNGYGTYHDGMAKAMKRILEIVPEGEGSGTALLGFSPLEYTAEEMSAISADVRAAVTFPGSDIRVLSGIRNAERNILLSSSAEPFARMMRSKFGVEYEAFMPGIKAEGNGDRQILVVGEQVRSNMIRNELRHRGADADVATFFTLSDSFSEEGDLKVRSEEHLTELVSSGYKCVIGDPIFRGLVPEKVSFIPDPQAAVSGRLFWNERIGIDSLGQMAERVAKSILD